MPRLTPFVKYLLIINCAVYVIQIIGWKQVGSGEEAFVEKWFAAKSLYPWQIWRLVTFQFLHGSTFHLLFNMIGLFFLGPTLERSWGSKKFLTFYLLCGAVGGALFLIGGHLSMFFGTTLVGASGGVLGLLVACAILFPHFVVILLFFPVPIRFAAFLLTGVYILSVISGVGNAGGDLCHLGGMATAFVWIMSRPYFAKWKFKQQEGAFQRKLEGQQQRQYEVDRILAKVHEQGVQSLTRKEKQILQDATEQQKYK
jgi:rhomboid family protein